MARFLGWNFVRIAAAVVLLTAAGLKTHQLATEPTLGNSLLESRWFLMATVEFELLFGFWLLANLMPRATWTAAVGCFAAFTCVSLYKALSGYASCGCFGRVPVNPWITTSLDVAIVLSLLRWRPSTMSSPLPLGEGQGEGSPKLPSPSSWRRAGGEGWFSRFPLFLGEGQGEGVSISSARLTLVTVLWLAVGFPAAYAMGSYADTTLSGAGEIIGNGKIVVLEPEKWTGKRFPLLPFIEDVSGTSARGERPLRERLTEGNWVVVFYRHNCPECREIIPRLGRFTRRSVGNPTSSRVALIEVPPYGNTNTVKLSPDAPHVLGQLSNTREWFIETPTILEISDLIVNNPKESH